MPEIFLIAKFVHICAVITMVGATIINGMIHVTAKSVPPEQSVTLVDLVLRINRLLMAPSLVAIPLSGFALVYLAGYSPTTLWIAVSIGLSLTLILAYLVGARLEQRLHRIAERSRHACEQTLPKEYGRTFQLAAPIGGGALLISLLAVGLMIFKPY